MQVRGIGRSPDGLGQRVVPQRPSTHYHADLEGEIQAIEPRDTSPAAAAKSAGVAALVASVGIGSGLVTGGPWGAGAGLMLSGALLNGYRAQKWINDDDPGRKHEAVVSGTLAVFEVLLGGYMIYKAYQSKTTEAGGRRG